MHNYLTQANIKQLTLYLEQQMLLHFFFNKCSIDLMLFDIIYLNFAVFYNDFTKNG